MLASQQRSDYQFHYVGFPKHRLAYILAKYI
jgi:hypothetical protein